MRKNEERMRNTIIEALYSRGQLSTKDAQELLQASESTVRRLFARMTDDKTVLRVFGGICLPNADNHYQYEKTIAKQLEEKTQIGQTAASFVRNDDFLFIDCGTTTLRLCESLAERIKQNTLSGITVVTNSFLNAEILAPYCKIILPGGAYFPERKSMAGTLCESFVNQFYFNIAFLGADGFSVETGFSTSEIEFAHLSGIAAAHSERNVVLLDSSKLGKRSNIVYDFFGNVREIVTDRKASNDKLEAVRSAGVILHIAE